MLWFIFIQWSQEPAVNYNKGVFFVNNQWCHVYEVCPLWKVGWCSNYIEQYFLSVSVCAFVCEFNWWAKEHEFKLFCRIIYVIEAKTILHGAIRLQDYSRLHHIILKSNAEIDLFDMAWNPLTLDAVNALLQSFFLLFDKRVLRTGEGIVTSIIIILICIFLAHCRTVVKIIITVWYSRT